MRKLVAPPVLTRFASLCYFYRFALAGSVVSGLAATYVNSFHFYVEPLRTMFNTSYSEAGLLPTLGLVFLDFSFPAQLTSHFVGYRRGIVVAGSLATVCQVAGSFSQTYTFSMVTLGLFNGIFLSIAYHCPVLAMSSIYSEEARQRATAIVFCGSGIGMMLFPPLYEVLKHAYAFRGAVLLMGAIYMNVVVCGVLFPDEAKTERERHSAGAGGEGGSWKPGCSVARNSVLLEWQTILLYGASFIVSFSSAMFMAYSLSILTLDYKLEETQAAVVITVGCVADFAGKLVIAAFPPVKSVPWWWIFCLMSLLLGVGVAMVGFGGHLGYVGINAFYAFYRFSLGSVYSAHAVLISHSYDAVTFPKVYGLAVMFMMFGCLLAPVTTGAIVDATNSFKVPLLISLGMFSLFLIPVIGYPLRVLFGKQKRSAENELLESCLTSELK